MAGLPTITVKLDDGTGSFPYNVSQYVDLSYPITLPTGRADEFSTTQPSIASLTFTNTDGRFTLGSATYNIRNDQAIRVTLTVGAVVAGRFTGYVQDWPVEWPDGGDTYAVASITATDVLAPLERRKLRSVYEHEQLADSPFMLYKLSDSVTLDQAGTDTTVAADTSGNQRPPMVVSKPYGAVAFAQNPGPVGFDGQLGINGGASGGDIAARAPDIALAANQSYTMEMLFQTTAGSDYQNLGYFATVPEARLFSVEPTSKRLYEEFSNAGAAAGPAVNDGAIHHGAIRCTFSGANETVAVFVDGVLTDSATFANSTTAQTSLVKLLLHVFNSNAWGAALYLTGLSDARIATHASAALTGFAGETGDARIARIAGYADLPVAASVSTPEVFAPVPAIPTNGVSVAAVIEAVRAAEYGVTYVRDGAIVCQNRQHRTLKSSPDVTITTDALAPSTKFAGDMQLVQNYVTVTRAGGVEQLVANQSSVDAHGQYPQSYSGLAVMTDEQALMLGNWIVSSLGEPAPRLPSGTVDLLTQTQAIQQAFLQMSVSDRLLVTGLPTQAPSAAGVGDLVIEGWTEVITKDSWELTFNASAWTHQQAWLLGDATYSVLGTTTRLGY